jgi:hypothetical protein
MEITLSTTQTTFDLSDVRLALQAALSREVILARSRLKAYERTCREFEEQFNITSDQFLTDFEAGRLGDDQEYFDWYAAKRAFDLWDRRTKILGGVVV